MKKTLADRFARPGLFFLFGFVVVNLFMMWKVHEHSFQGYGDFASFYTAGKIVRSGQSMRLYDPGLQWSVQQQFASKVTIRLGPLPYIRPPFEALLFLPFTYVSYPVAYVIWLLLKIILLFLALLVMPRFDEVRPSFRGLGVEMLLCLAYFPVGFDLLHGQDSILVLLILVLGLKLWLNGANFGSGAVLALGLFKFHLLVPLIAILALRRQWRVLLGFSGVAAALFAVSVYMVRWRGILHYPKYLWSLDRLPGFGMAIARGMPNFRGLATVFLGDGAFPPAAKWTLFGITAIGVLIGTAYFQTENRRSALLGFCFAIAVILATSYYANSYDLTLLLLPLLILGPSFLRGIDFTGWPRNLFLGSTAVLLFTPLLWVLAVNFDQTRWIALAVVALAISLAGAAKAAGVDPRVPVHSLAAGSESSVLSLSNSACQGSGRS